MEVEPVRGLRRETTLEGASEERREITGAGRPLSDGRTVVDRRRTEFGPIDVDRGVVTADEPGCTPVAGRVTRGVGRVTRELDEIDGAPEREEIDGRTVRPGVTRGVGVTTDRELVEGLVIRGEEERVVRGVIVGRVTLGVGRVTRGVGRVTLGAERVIRDDGREIRGDGRVIRGDERLL